MKFTQEDLLKQLGLEVDSRVKYDEVTNWIVVEDVGSYYLFRKVSECGFRRVPITDLIGEEFEVYQQEVYGVPVNNIMEKLDRQIGWHNAGTKDGQEWYIIKKLVRERIKSMEEVSDTESR